MLNYINNLEIKNYKSIKEMKIDCSRINLFIGKPNVGKSNILEAISLLGNPSGNKFFSDYINYEDISNLCTDSIIENTISVISDNTYALIKYYKEKSFFGFFVDLTTNELDFEILESSNFQEFNNYFNQSNPKQLRNLNEYKFSYIMNFNGEPNATYTLLSNIYNYKFKKSNDTTNIEVAHLLPPFGNNLFKTISSNELLRGNLVSILNSYNLELLYKPADNIYKIQKKIKGVVYDTPFSLIADTIQRIIFYKAAIYSNANSVLIFEEPEVNSFPPYIQELARDIVDSKTNQFFISTHSPYLLNTILESAGTDASLFIVDYKNNQTVIKKLTEEEIAELLDYGTDIFLNIKDYSIDDR